MSKLELAKEKIKEFYPKILVEVLDVFGPYDVSNYEMIENDIIRNAKFIGEYAAKSFETNYEGNEGIVNMVAETEDIISLNALVMFMCVDVSYSLSPLNHNDYYINRFNISLYIGKIYQKTSVLNIADDINQTTEGGND